jgi:hypothetical protein
MSAEAFETEGMTWQEKVEWAEANDTYVTGTYTLTATKDGYDASHLLPMCSDDTEASWRGMAVIARLASKEQGSLRKFWSKGRIELRDPDGEVVRAIEEKP